MTTAVACWQCERDGERSHAPMADEFCASCGEPYFDGCKREHHHDAWTCDGGAHDIRRLWCGCYAHKECQKSGNHCRQHGYQDDMLGGADQLYFF